MGKWFWGIIILAVISLLLSLFGPWNANKRSAEMKASIETALTANGYDFASVDMSGNIATISGEAPTQEVKQEVLELVSNTECETCKKTGNIWHEASVEKMTIKPAPVIPVISPYTFNATKGVNQRVVLDGEVRNQPELDRILREARTLFGTNNVVDNKLSIARGAPAPQWGDVISKGMTDLNLLDSGRLVINDQQLLLTGDTTDVAVRQRINADIATLPATFNGAINIRVAGTAAENVGEVQSESVCQVLFNQLKGDTKINFASDKAEIRGAPSYDLLNTLAQAANQCASFRIQIDGHTDSDGDDAYNQQLSQMRADRVVTYLADNGVELSRMNATGFGETQPVASNNTAEGKARNRRIEFTVTQSE